MQLAPYEMILLSTFTTSILNSYHHKKKIGKGFRPIFLRNQWEFLGLCTLMITFRRKVVPLNCFSRVQFSWFILFLSNAFPVECVQKGRK